MPAKIQDATIWRRLQQRFAIVGRHVLLLDEIVVPVVVVDDLTDDVVADAVNFTVAMQVEESVGKKSTAVLLNDRVGWQIIVDEVLITTPANTIPVIRLSVTPPLSAIAGGFASKTWNNRLQIAEPPGLMFGDDGTFTGPIVWSHSVLSHTPRSTTGKYVLDEGEEIAISGNVNATIIRVSMKCRALRIP